MYDAINNAIEISKGDIIGIVNADDILSDCNVITNIVDKFLNSTDVDFVHGSVNVVNSESKIIGKSSPISDSLISKRVKYEMPILHPSLYVRKHVYSTLGLYCLSYRIVADYEFVIRLFSSSFVGLRLDFPVSNYRVGGMSGTVKGIFETLKLHKEIGLPLLHRYLIFSTTYIKLQLSSLLPSWILRLLSTSNKRHTFS
jgi:hypothetical protein